MGDGALDPLTRAVAARAAGKAPTAADLAACRKAAWKQPTPHCWNGKRSDRPECNWVGSQNIPVYAMAGLGDWAWFAELARLERVEGGFGHEIGSPGAFYYGGIMGCRVLALRHLSGEDAEAVRLSIRSALAWDAMTALPVARRRDVLIAGGKEEQAAATKVHRPLTVAVAGNRWTSIQRGELLSEDSHSQVFNAALTTPKLYGGLTVTEYRLLMTTLQGDAGAAAQVAGWMFGTIDSPDKRWRFRLRRTTEGVEVVYFGPWPNPHKPCQTVTQVTHDGTWRGMRPTPPGTKKGWANGYDVGIRDGVIYATCRAGSAELPELGGEVLWQVDVEGRDVRFTTSAGAT